ncbi:H-type lectin domain-containing protein [Tranquillimonas alkanivorans]|uniref:H-type lectin domain-containing protein n=1 Tax=Tranquillimonas alkanivorans TaxID=441119 RepID=A0A1I5NC86_9RHOB|nr:H-type lectin domain-containing protein [Tranquillimonas alkanivorans]SFP19383.1 H-type lectin domain-containing protein [Tranquillimonas alkanivorans]
MKTLAGHRLGIAQGSVVLFSDFADGGAMWTGEGARQVRREVAFDGAFLSPPMVQVGLSMWDTGGGTNQRLDIAHEAVTEGGFRIVFSTWGDTRIARVRADWLALGEVRDEDLWEVD